MEDQTTILDQQKVIMKTQGDNSEKIGESQIELIKEQNKQLELQTKIDVEPLLDIYFENDILQKHYTLVIENRGIFKVKDIIIQKELKCYDIQNFYATGIYFREIFSRINSVSVGDKKIESISYHDFDKAWQLARGLEFVSDTLAELRTRRFPTLLFKILYRREGDNKEYRLKKFLFLIKGTIHNKKEITGYDPDVEFTQFMGDQMVYAKVKEIENKEPWLRRHIWYNKK